MSSASVVTLMLTQTLTIGQSVCVLGPEGGRGEADGERERTSAEIRRAADGERSADQQRSEILSNTQITHSCYIQILLMETLKSS